MTVEHIHTAVICDVGHTQLARSIVIPQWSAMIRRERINMREWKTMDSAPTDGTRIKVRGWDFGIQGSRRHYAIARFETGRWIEVDSNGNELRYLTDWQDAPFRPACLIDDLL
jgi:hypothetical protein